MTAPNRNALWGRVIVAELAAAGVTTAVVAPGSRSTPVAIALDRHDDVRVYSHLDERSAAFFALGRGKRTGIPTPVVCTSGTAAANFHPAVIEADEARVPLLCVTADRPPELADSGANQTVDQTALFGDAVRWYRTLPEPEADDRKLRALRTSIARAAARCTGTPPGPVHLNVPFRKPLEPTAVDGDVPGEFDVNHRRAARGRTGPYVRTTPGRPTLDSGALSSVSKSVEAADAGLVIAGPRAVADADVADAIAALGSAAGFPVLADPLSGVRFGPAVGEDGATICGGYSGYLTADVTDGWLDPEIVVRFGASPTSKRLRRYLAGTGARQFVVDPAGGWREETFTATDLLSCDPAWLANELSEVVTPESSPLHDALAETEASYWDLLGDQSREHEGAYVAAALAGAPDPATVFVSNSMPVRDLDRFGRPRRSALTVLGNRGASGIDGITSTALGAGSATEDPLVCVTGDLAFVHDLTGLVAVDRCDVDATIVVIDNDGGGIFHRLPIADFDPPFTELFRTPHGLDFEPAADLFGLEFVRVAGLDEFRSAYGESLQSDGTQVIDVVVDAESSHHVRDRIDEDVRSTLAS